MIVLYLTPWWFLSLNQVLIFAGKMGPSSLRKNHKVVSKEVQQSAIKGNMIMMRYSKQLLIWFTFKNKSFWQMLRNHEVV